MPEPTCSIDGCEKSFKARGWCVMHYGRWTRNKAVGEAAPRCSSPMDSVEERLARRGWTVTDAGCHEWNGSRLSNGYGTVVLPGRKFAYVHRVVYALKHGPIPDGLSVCHTCDNPPCSNVDHLFLGTHAENSGDSVKKSRQAWGVKNGHAKLTPAQVLEIRDLCLQGIPQPAIAARYGISQGNVSAIHVRKSWTLLGELEP